MMESDFQAALQAYQQWAKQIPHLTLDELLGLQQVACRVLLRHAQQHTTLWQQQLAGRNVHAMAWEEVPTSDRALISERFAESVSDSRLDASVVHAHFRQHPETYLFHQYQVFLSAGKTGQLTAFVYDRLMWQTFLAATLRRFFGTGIDVRKAPRIAFVGTNAPAHTLTRTARVFPVDMGGMFGLQDGLTRCVAALQIFDPEVLYGFSSAVALLAEQQLEGALNISPKLVLMGTDGISEAQKALVRHVWQTRPLNSYACTEGGSIAFECSCQQLHINEDLVYLEVRDGHLLVTNLVNRVQPFIRYMMPDHIGLSASPCPCGLPYRTLVGMDGRLNEPLALPGNEARTVKIHPIVLRTALDTLPGVLSSEARWLPGTLQVKIWGDVDVPMARDRLNSALHRAGAATNAFTVEIARA